MIKVFLLRMVRHVTGTALVSALRKKLVLLTLRKSDELSLNHRFVNTLKVRLGGKLLQSSSITLNVMRGKREQAGQLKN